MLLCKQLAMVWVALLFLSGQAHGQELVDCAGSPPGAVMTLPPPLSDWGQLVCTEFGHVITSRDGWIWSQPGAYSPVFFPAQMVRMDPKPLGNRSYFTMIDMQPIDGDERDKAYAPMRRLFPVDPVPAKTYRLNLESASGNSLLIYFFDDGDKNRWGISCGTRHVCDSDSTVFLVLNMTRPRT